MKTTLTNFILSAPIMRLKKSLDRKIKVSTEALNTLQIERKRALDNGGNSIAEIYNVSIYLAIASNDLAVIRTQMLIEQDKTIKNVYSRQLALFVYEFLNDCIIL